jgi:hypothetical protein
MPRQTIGKAAQIIIDDLKVRKVIKNLHSIMPKYMHAGLVESLDHIGLLAVSKMPARPWSREAGMQRARIPGSQINKVTLRLSKSILNEEGQWGKEGIRRIEPADPRPGDDITAIIGSRVPYAAIHEFGGHFSIISRHVTIKMPRRPYLRPALKDSHQWIFNKMSEMLDKSKKDSGD